MELRCFHVETPGGEMKETSVESALAAPAARESGIEVCQSAVAEERDSAIERTVDRLVLVHRAATLQLALDIGAIVVQELCGGSVEVLRERGEKDCSLRKLAAHPRLPFSPSTLWRSIGIYELVRREPEFVQWEHLKVAHFRAVLGLPREKQVSLLREAAENGRSSSWVVRRASQVRLKGGRGSHRRDALRSVRRVEELTRACPVPGSLSPAELEEDERAAIVEHVRRVRAWCSVVEGWLGE